MTPKISERTLKNWRTDALRRFEPSMYDGTARGLADAYVKANERILRLTQEMMDLHLKARIK